MPPKPYGISYRSIIPRTGECENLLSPVCLSASHVAHGSIRMEPVFMALGQSAAAAAVLAIDDGVSVQEVDYVKLGKQLEAEGQIVRAHAAASKVETKPNIVMILADDLGIECLSSYGGTSHKTPNLDKLAAQGMRFSDCFSNPYCSPSRASLLTGRYPFKNGLKQVIFDAKQHANTYLHPDQPSFARQIKQSGYATGIAGKWHLSFLYQHDTIRDFGFEQYQCWQIFDDDMTRTRRFHTPYYNRNGVIIADEIKDQYGPDVNVEFLIDFIKSNAAKKQPFLAYYTSLLPHFPWVPTPDSEDKSYIASESVAQGEPEILSGHGDLSGQESSAGS